MNYIATIAWISEYCLMHIWSIRTSSTMARWSHRLVQEAFLCYQLTFRPMEPHTQSDDLWTGLTTDLSRTQSDGSYGVRTGYVQLALGISGSSYLEGGLSQSVTQIDFWDMESIRYEVRIEPWTNGWSSDKVVWTRVRSGSNQISNIASGCYL